MAMGAKWARRAMNPPQAAASKPSSAVANCGEAWAADAAAVTCRSITLPSATTMISIATAPMAMRMTVSFDCGLTTVSLAATAPHPLQGVAPEKSNGSSHGGWCHQKLPETRQHRLKRPPRAAGAGIVAAKLFAKLFVSVDKSAPLLDVGLGRESFAALARYLKRKPGCGCDASWDTSCVARNGPRHCIQKLA